jgi:toxin ParE1/3/4
MRIEWSTTAIADLNQIISYIEELNPSAAMKIANAIQVSTQLLAEFPELGKPTGSPDIRLYQVAKHNYLLPYLLEQDALTILAVFDMRRERPESWKQPK